MAAGGRVGYDPFVALAFCAASTTTLRLLTYLAVLAYRNPVLVLKAAATDDHHSGGRLTLVTGSGYHRSEFAALGVPFEDRNAHTDEALELLDSVYHTAISFEGSSFASLDPVCSPGCNTPGGRSGSPATAGGAKSGWPGTAGPCS